MGVGDHVRARTPDGEQASSRWSVRPCSRSTTTPRRARGRCSRRPDSIRCGAATGSRSLLLEYPPGVDAGPLEEDAGRGLRAVLLRLQPTEPPWRVSNLDGVRGVTVALGAFFAVLAVVGLAHVLAISSRRRRLDFAVLRALGFRRRQVPCASVTVQAVVITALGLVVGVPVGLVGGPRELAPDGGQRRGGRRPDRALGPPRPGPARRARAGVVVAAGPGLGQRPPPPRRRAEGRVMGCAWPCCGPAGARAGGRCSAWRCIIGVAGGAVLTGVEAARRTDTAFDRLLDGHRGVGRPGQPR